METREEPAAAENAAHEQQEPRRLPDDFACLWCGYDARGLTAWRCPECGREFDEVDVRTHEHRKTVRSRAVRMFVVRMSMLIIVVFGLMVALLFTRLGGLWPWSPLFLLGSLGVVAFTAAGGALCACAPTGFRRMHLWVWIKSQGVLHSPWLSVGVGAVVFLSAAQVVAYFDVERLKQALRAAVYLGGLIWLVIVLPSLRQWTAGVRETEHELNLLPSGVRPFLLAAGWGVAVSAVVMGAFGGVLAWVWVLYTLKN